MKKRMISLALSLALCLSLSVPAFAAQSTFTDVPPTFWAYDYIERAAADGAVNGVGNNKFNPNGTLTVAHWMVIMTRAFFGSRVDASTATGTWYAKNKDVADQVDLLNGVSNTNMNSAINRYDMAQIVYNVLSLAGGLVMGVFEDYDVHLVKDRIGDWNKVPQRYKVAVGTVFDKGIIMGTDDKGTFNGSGTFTRAQAAAVYTRMTKFFDMDFVAPDISESEIIEPEDIVTAPVENASPEKTLKNGKAVTEENVLEIIEELKVKYPDGSRYDPNTAYYSRGIGRSGIECAKLAFMLSDEIFGDLPAQIVTNYDLIRPGDIVYFKTPSNRVHWYMVVSSPGDDPTGDNYYCTVDGGSKGIVRWSDYPDECLAGVSDEMLNRAFSELRVYSRY